MRDSGAGSAGRAGQVPDLDAGRPVRPVDDARAAAEGASDLDRAVDRCYRPEPFPSDRHRVENLLPSTNSSPPRSSPPPSRPGRGGRRNPPETDAIS